MSAFTPGPWEFGGIRYGGTSWPFGWIMAPNAEKGPLHVAEVRGWGHLTGSGHGALGLSEDDAAAIQLANARLIAAAPELLAACERALRVLRHVQTSSKGNVLGQLEGAIAKATGEA